VSEANGLSALLCRTTATDDPAQRGLMVVCETWMPDEAAGLRDVGKAATKERGREHSAPSGATAKKVAPCFVVLTNLPSSGLASRTTSRIPHFITATSAAHRVKTDRRFYLHNVALRGAEPRSGGASQ